MRNVVVIGGGLSGLAAAYELQKHHIHTTLIEVKPRLGGSIETVAVNGFAFDSGAMTHDISEPQSFEAYLVEIGVIDRAFVTEEGQLAFDGGTGLLVDALVARLENVPTMLRMAVSTLGMIDSKHFSICMENGMVLDARALIVAVPARYAERLFHTLVPEISYQLLDYRYDTITRVSLGYRHASPNVVIPPDTPVTEVACISGKTRSPSSDSAVVQAALRFAPHDLPQDPVGELAALMGWPLNPDADHIATWPESDPAAWRSSDHIDKIALIQNLLPPGVAIAGSDYIPTSQPPRLDERIQQGINAARRIMSMIS